MASGRIAVGDDIVVLPAGLPARIVEILTADGSRGEASADQAVTLRLDREIDVSRGDVFATPAAAPRVTREFDAELCWFDSDLLQPARSYLLKHGTRHVKARFQSLGARLDFETLLPGAPAQTLAMNDIASVRLQVQQPIAVDAYRRNRITGAFILIDETTNRTVAAGTIA
ncbi:MAG: hypothetical protein ABI831_19030 [Betaproteobacteria bacterium]